MSKKFGFTLAEVLITLGIIGVVAAITIPVLINKFLDTSRITALKKAYSILSQATLSIIAEQGSPDNWGLKDRDAESIDKVYNYYKSYIKVLGECNYVSECFNVPVVFLDNSILYSDDESAVSFEQRYFRTVDGIVIAMDISDGSLFFNNIGVNIAPLNATVWFRVDVNGPKKPNKVGYDIFHFVLTNSGLKPAGANNNSLYCNKNNKGYDCAAKVLSENKISY